MYLSDFHVDSFYAHLYLNMLPDFEYNVSTHDGLTLAGCQGPPSLCVTPHLSWTGERKYGKVLVGQQKDREIIQ